MAAQQFLSFCPCEKARIKLKTPKSIQLTSHGKHEFHRRKPKNASFRSAGMAFQKQCLSYSEGTKKSFLLDKGISQNSIHVPVCLVRFLKIVPKSYMNIIR